MLKGDDANEVEEEDLVMGSVCSFTDGINTEVVLKNEFDKDAILMKTLRRVNVGRGRK